MQVFSTIIDFVNPITVTVRAIITPGMPNFKINGMYDKRYLSLFERIKTVFKTCGIKVPATKVRVEISHDIQKCNFQGLELPIAISLLLAIRKVRVSEKIAAFGKLNSGGHITTAPGYLHFLDQYRQFSQVLTASSQFTSSAQLGFNNFTEILHYFKYDALPLSSSKVLPMMPDNESLPTIDLVSGNESGKRALLIAAAGRHHILLSGPTGNGKSILASCLASLLPTPNEHELAGNNLFHNLFTEKIVSHYPVVSISPVNSKTEIFGSVSMKRIGAVSASHKGILHIEELSEFNNQIINHFRTILDNKHIKLIRNSEDYKLPADFQMIATSNLCPCAKLGLDQSNCTCSDQQIHRYQNKVSTAIKERIDIHSYINESNLNSDSKPLHDKYLELVKSAHKLQQARFASLSIKANSQASLNIINSTFNIAPAASEVLKEAQSKFDSSTRDQIKTMQIARTIADLEGDKKTEPPHILEALSYRYRPKSR